ncbi:hypothetical protein FXO37_00334 [Capsicum annuum]|nr:hypothetical protein FXO37_00334 [Capsicum annuum]
MAQHANRNSSFRGSQPMNLVFNELPSFSLGLTQDEDFNLSSSNIQPKGGVSSEEARLKHRNNLKNIVKKIKRKGLRKPSSPKPQKIQKSMKKRKPNEKGESSKILSPVSSDFESKEEKVEEILHDQIYMARVLPKFAPHIGCHMVNDIEDRIKSILKKNQYKIFCNNSIFAVFMKKKICMVQVLFERCIMSLDTKESTANAIVIRVKGTNLHFSPRESAVVTGLNCVSNKDYFVFDEDLSNRIIEKYFDGANLLNWKTNASRPRYESLMESMFNDADAKVSFKNIEPTRKEISFFRIPKKIVRAGVSHKDDEVNSADDFQDPLHPQKHSITKKNNGNSSTSPVKKKFKKQHKDKVSSKRKDINRSASKKSIPVQSPDSSSFSSGDEDDFVLKKMFDKFRNEKKDKDNEVDNLSMGEADKSTLHHESTPKFVHDLYKNSEGTLNTKSIDDNIGEAHISNSQFLFSDEVFRSIHLDFIKSNLGVKDESKNTGGAAKMTVNTSTEDESKNKQCDAEKIVNKSENYQAEMNKNKSPKDESKILSPLEHNMDKSKLDQQNQSAVHIYEAVIEESKAEQNLPDSYIYVSDSLSSAGHDAEVPAEVEKLAEVIPICLIAYKFYEKKGIDIANHPNYKSYDKMDLFDVYVVEDLPQQPSGSLDCGLYMVTYAECFTFGDPVPPIDFDPDLIRTRYASIFWDYGIRKEEEKAQSDYEAPMRPPYKIERLDHSRGLYPWYGIDTLPAGVTDLYVHVYDLLDPGASLSFVTPYIAVDFGISPKILAEPFSVPTLVGKTIIAWQVYRNCPIMIFQKVTSADLVELEMTDFDVILSMDCLHSFYATVNSKNRIVQFQFPNEPILEWKGSVSIFRVQLISYLWARKMISKGCVYHLVHVKDSSSETPSLESVPFINE